MLASSTGTVLVIGGEPAAFSCALRLLETGQSVCHVYPVPFGLAGASRDIGLAYPEVSEPWERLSYALGPELALEYHQWSKLGIESLAARLPGVVTRGSRLSITRTETEAKLSASDAITRSQAPVNDEVRLMSGAAASNFAPIEGANQAAFETHALKFVPVEALTSLAAQLKNMDNYRFVELDHEELWQAVRVSLHPESVKICAAERVLADGDMIVVAAGFETSRLLQKLSTVVVPFVAQAFRTPALKEKTRTSVVGLSASWGYEKYRFDSEYRLLGCGLDPSRGGGEQEVIVNEKSMRAFLNRASQLFTDFDGKLEDLTQWAVQYTGTCDGLPILGPLPGEPRVHVAAGFFLSAWSRGWQAGSMLGDLISGRNQSNTNSMLYHCNLRRF